MRSLLDINVLIALLDPDHSNHPRAQDWWKVNRTPGWASCPLTENGFVRILSNPKYPADIPAAPGQRITDLRDFVSMGNHEFWPDDISILDDTLFDATRVMGPRQLTDLYLLALAANHKGRLVTFDERIPLSAIRNASGAHLCVI